MQNGAWSDALLSYLNEPDKHNDVVYHDDKVVVVRDKYPKAKCHLLMIPCEILPIGVADLSVEHLPLLHHMNQLVEILSIHSQLRFGFHAIPSMRQFHLHIISDDFISPSLKHKKHWNSFTTSFFKAFNDVFMEIEKEGHININIDREEDKLKNHLTCHRCNTTISNMPKLKQHLLNLHPATIDSPDRIISLLNTRIAPQKRLRDDLPPSPSKRPTTSSFFRSNVSTHPTSP